MRESVEYSLNGQTLANRERRKFYLLRVGSGDVVATRTPGLSGVKFNIGVRFGADRKDAILIL